MAEFAQKWQAIISLFVMVFVAGIAWSQIDNRVAHVEQTIIEEQEDRKDIVRELRLIRDEIVSLRIATARTNQRLEDHIITDK